MTTASETTRKPKGSLLITLGLCLAGLSLLIVVLAVANGGTATIYTIGAVIVGLVLAAIGFGMRVSGALERH